MTRYKNFGLNHIDYHVNIGGVYEVVNNKMVHAAIHKSVPRARVACTIGDSRKIVERHFFMSTDLDPGRFGMAIQGRSWLHV
jgi:hypothetical protein